MLRAPTTLSMARVVVLLVVVLCLFVTIEGWNVPSKTSNRISCTTMAAVSEDGTDSTATGDTSNNSVPRRSMLVSLSFAVPILFGKNVAHAACLYGDLSPNCIGVYKVPMESDTTIRNMVGTSNAPSLNSYSIPPIPIPRSVQEAQRILETQRRIADDIAATILAGRLQQAGIQVLSLLPPLIVSGRVLLEHVVSTIMANRNNNDPTNETSNAVVTQLQRERFEEMWQTNEVAWNTVDITIGQGLSGTLGVSAVAQLAILEELRDATLALDDFLTHSNVYLRTSSSTVLR